VTRTGGLPTETICTETEIKRVADAKLPREGRLSFLATTGALSMIQVRRSVRRVKDLVEPVLPALWTLVPAMREFRAFGLGPGYRKTGGVMKSGLHRDKLTG
jgi:hypothetical protein